MIIPSIDVQDAKLGRRSLAHFFRQSWHVLEPPGNPLIWNWHLQAMCDHVQALYEHRLKTNNLIENVPPGSSKSIILAVSLAWQWLEHPEFRALFTSSTPSLVYRDSRRCRQVIASSWYQETFKPEWNILRKQDSVELFANTAGGFRQSLGKGAVTGVRVDGIFMDDMLPADQGESEAERTAFKTRYDAALHNRLSSPMKGIRCMIAQRLHYDDPVAYVQKADEWDVLIIPQVYKLVHEDPDNEKSPLVHRKPTALGWVDPRQTPGELMDAVRFPQSAVDSERRILGERGFAAQHEQEPTSSEGAILKRASFRSYRTPTSPRGFALTPVEICRALGITRIAIGADTALGEKSQNDYTAAVVIGESDLFYYVLDLLVDRLTSPATKLAFSALWAKWAASALVIEGGSSASGKAVAQTLKDETKIPVIEQPVYADKIVAMNRIAPTVEARLVYVPEDQPWTEPLLQNLTRFPVAEHDDIADAFRISINYLIAGGGNLGHLEYLRRLKLGHDKRALDLENDDAPKVAPIAGSAAVNRIARTQRSLQRTGIAPGIPFVPPR